MLACLLHTKIPPVHNRTGGILTIYGRRGGGVRGVAVGRGVADGRGVAVGLGIAGTLTVITRLVALCPRTSLATT